MRENLTPGQSLFLWRMIAGETKDVREPMKSEATPSISKKERDGLIERGYLAVEEKQSRGRRSADFLSLSDQAWAWAADTFDVEIVSSEFASPTLQGLLRRLLPFLATRGIPLATLFPVAPAIGQATPPAKQTSTKTTKASAKKTSSKKTSAKKASSKKVSVSKKASAKKTSTKKARAKVAPQRSPTRKAPTKATTKQPSARSPQKALAKETMVPLATQIEEACLALARGRRKERVRLSALRKRLPLIRREDLDRELVQMQGRDLLVLYRDDHTSALTEEDHSAALIVGDSPRHLVYLEG